MPIVEDQRAVGVADVVFVEAGQDVAVASPTRFPAEQAGVEECRVDPVGRLIDAGGLQFFPSERDREASVGEGEPAPPSQVSIGGWSVSRDITCGESLEGFVPFEGYGRGHSVVEERESLGLAVGRSDDDSSGLG
nr:hypothetical protein [Actinacidiphila oryziradicis]